MPAPSAACVIARSAALARELRQHAARPPQRRRHGRQAVEIAAESGLDVEVFDKDQLDSSAAAACSASTRRASSRRA